MASLFTGKEGRLDYCVASPAVCMYVCVCNIWEYHGMSAEAETVTWPGTRPGIRWLAVWGPTVVSGLTSEQCP